MFTILKNRTASHGSNKGRITCTSCALKKCIGQCHFERESAPRPRKAA